jgi:hypothetical protein
MVKLTIELESFWLNEMGQRRVQEEVFQGLINFIAAKVKVPSKSYETITKSSSTFSRFVFNVCEA